jgi:putative ABC transport system permease protein
MHLAIAMLLHNRTRAIAAVVGVAVAFFLGAAQFGLLVGWVRTCTAIIRHSDVDAWVMAEHTVAFDYGTPIPEFRVQQVRTISEVEWAEAMLVSWTFWKLPNGKQQNVELIGLDEDLVGGPWRMQEGAVDTAQGPEQVIVDALYQDRLGISYVGDEVEVLGRRAVVGARSLGVRTLTVAPFVFTSLENARRYDPWHKGDEITFVLARGRKDVTAEMLRNVIKSQVPAVEVLTSAEFAERTARYWMLETGLGVTVVLTAGLGMTVGMVIISQTLYALTHENLSHYATLLAAGFSRTSLVGIVLIQATCLAACGVAVGSALLLWSMRATAATPIPIETTATVFTGVLIACFASSWGASLLPIRTIFRIDPVSVFHN